MEATKIYNPGTWKLGVDETDGPCQIPPSWKVVHPLKSEEYNSGRPPINDKKWDFEGDLGGFEEALGI